MNFRSVKTLNITSLTLAAVLILGGIIFVSLASRSRRGNRKEPFLYEADPGLEPDGKNFYANPLYETSTRYRIREDRSGYGSIYDDSLDPDRIGVGFPVYGPG